MKYHYCRLFLILLLAGLVSGCMHYKRVMQPSQLDVTYNGKLEVLTNDGTTYRLEESSVGVDRIIGWGTEFLSEGTHSKFSGTIPFSEIQLVKTDNLDAFGSILTVGTVGFLVYGLIRETNEDNGTPVNVDITYPSGGSCPYVFTFDGQQYHFESETFSGAVCPALERTVVDAIRYLKPVNGFYHLAVADNSPESQHINELSLIEMRHPKGTVALPDASGRIHTIRDFLPVISAQSFDGDDMTKSIASVDSEFWRSDSTNYTRPEQFRFRDGVICKFRNPQRSSRAKIIFTGKNTSLGYFALETIFALRGPAKLNWYHQLANDTGELAELQKWIRHNGGLDFSVQSGDSWQLKSWLPDVGPMAVAERVIPLDLGDTPDSMLVVKLESTTDLWSIDRIAVDYSDDQVLSENPLLLVDARFDDGRDVTGQFAAVDSEYVSLVPGRYSLLTYSAGAGRSCADDTCSIMLRSRGFYYSWTPEESSDQSEISEAMLAGAPIGYQAFLERWLPVRHRWEKLYEHQPEFCVKSR